MRSIQNDLVLGYKNPTSKIEMKLRELALIESELERVRAEFENDSLVRSKQISFDDFYRMDSIREWNLDRNHSSKTRPSSLSFRYCCYFLVLILILAYLGRSIDFYSYRRRSQSNCLVPLPNYLQNAFVPAQDCRFCREITEIKRERSISSEEFSKKYLLVFVSKWLPFSFAP